MSTNQEPKTAHSRAVVPGVDFTEAGQQRALDMNAAVWAYLHGDTEYLQAYRLDAQRLVEQADRVIGTLKPGAPADADHLAAIRTAMAVQDGPWPQDARLQDARERFGSVMESLDIARRSTEFWDDPSAAREARKENLSGVMESLFRPELDQNQIFMRQAVALEAEQPGPRFTSIARAADVYDDFCRSYAVLDTPGVTDGRSLMFGPQSPAIEGIVRKLTREFAYQATPDGQLVVHHRSDLHKPGSDSPATYPRFLLREGANLKIRYATNDYGAHIERNKPAEAASAAVSGKERRWFGRF